MAIQSDKGSRLAVLFQNLEKFSLTPAGPGNKVTFEEQQAQLKSTTSKIVAYLQTPEKGYRDVILKNQQFITLLLSVLENSTDYTTDGNVINILLEVIGKSHVNKRATILVSHGSIHTIFQKVVKLHKDPSAPLELLLSLHTVLNKIGAKDRKFGVKARLLQALPVTLALIKTTTTDMCVLQPVLPVLKLLSHNVVNASFLGKNGAITQLFKILQSCGRKHLGVVKTILESLHLLVKSKSNSARAIGHGGVPILLNMFSEWHKADSKNRHISLRKGLLKVLKSLTDLKSGQQALAETEGMQVLYMVCCESSEVSELESMIIMASVILRKCFPRNRLPLNSLRHPLSFPLPHSSFHIINTGEGPDRISPVNNGYALTVEPNMALADKYEVPSIEVVPHVSMSQCSNVSAGDENGGYESSLDHDDDLSSDGGDDVEVTTHEADTDIEEVLTHGPYLREWEDLMQYKEFFPERIDFQIPLPDDPSAVVQFSLGLGQGSDDTSPDLLSDLDSLSLQSEPLSRPTQSGMPKDSTWPVFLTNNHSAVLNPTAINIQTGSKVFSLDCVAAAARDNVASSGLKPRHSATRAMGRHRQTSKGGTTQGERSKHRNHRWRQSQPKVADALEADGNTGFKSAASAPVGLNSMTTEQLRSLLAGVQPTEPGPTEEEINKMQLNDEDVFMDIASKTISVGRFNKVPFPDLHGSYFANVKEPICGKTCGLQRNKIFEDIERFVHPELLMNEVVYSMDQDVDMLGEVYVCHYSSFSNDDATRVFQPRQEDKGLRFNSQFESGNLRKAIRIRQYEYDLILNPDLNTNHHHQWFYFEVSNMEANKPYRFNIVNCEKLNSQFNYGMKLVMYSVRDALAGSPCWSRVGSELCYYRNHFVRSSQTTGGTRGKAYYTATFTLNFKYDNDVCYVAYHYPYSFSSLQYHLRQWENNYDKNTIYFRNQNLTKALSGNPVPVLTVTGIPSSTDTATIQQLRTRPYIFLTSRVHPGESNASWVMKGTIDYLLSSKAQALREQYIFKIVPMLNPDGVINGNHRCSLTAEDLNRRWFHPCPQLHPTIFHTKGLLHYLHMHQLSPLVFCDYHGHSRRKNVFLYGCSPVQSWMSEDLNNPAVVGPKLEDISYRTLPRLLDNIAPAFSMQNCSYMVEKVKETSARVVVWRQMGVVRSYTMESTYCGCDQGIYKGLHLGIKELEEMGQKFCEALVKVRSRHVKATKIVANVPPVGLPSDAEKAENNAPPSTSTINHSNSDDSDQEEDEDMEDDDDEDDDMEDELL